MKRALLTILSLISLSLPTFAFDVVLPSDKKNAVTTDYAFFVGKVNNGEKLSINGKSIYTAPNGAFAHSVKLKNGNNRIVLRSKYTTKIYTFYKKQDAMQKEEPLHNFDKKHAVVINDNTPLRSTPVDAGMNRIGHLFSGTNLILDGEKGDFYRVFLSGKRNGWIAKNAVNITESEENIPAQFLGMNSEKYKNASIQTIEFTKKLPYTVEEKDREILFKIYNPELSDESVYNLSLPKYRKYSYSVNLENGTYTFKINSMPKKADEYTVVIDAGHGGSEKGALGCLGDEEKDINLKIAYELQNKLAQKGIKTIMTRECDGDVDLYDRVKIAEQNDANIFVSIHLNSISDICMDVHKNRGTSVYYYNNNSKKLAEYVEKHLVNTIGTKSEGTKTASFAVLRSPKYAGVLVEVAYMTNPLDSMIYSADDFAKKAAEGIADGLIKYIN